VRWFETGSEEDRFCGAHSGYERLPAPVTPVRTIVLDHRRHALTITDAFEGAGRHRIEIPLHLAPGVTASEESASRLVLRAGGRAFWLDWEPAGSWSLTIGEGRVSPSYGILRRCVRLLWTREGGPAPALAVRLAPALRS